MLLRLGAEPAMVPLASRSRKGCWRMSTNSIVQAALKSEWLGQQGIAGFAGALGRLSLPAAAEGGAGSSGAGRGGVNPTKPPDADRMSGGVGDGG